MRRVACLWLSCAVCALLSSCAQTAHTANISEFTGWNKPYANCREKYREMDARVDAAGVREASSWRVPGYPYLRTDRMLASLRGQVKGLNDVSEFTRRMRELDQEARDVEYVNLGMSDLDRATQRDRFLNCGRILAAIELEDPADWARMVQVAVPEDAYSTSARVLGVYPLAAISMKSRAETAREAAMTEYQKAPGDGAAAQQMRLWTVQPVEDLSLIANAAKDVQINPLGFPGFFGSQWRALAERHAPKFWIETRDENDLPAAPVFEDRGLTANVARNQVNYLITYTRLGPDLLVQISYFLWFKSADGASTGPIDGLIWRVTLDTQYRPMTYESLHASGRDHRWYLVQPLKERTEETHSHEAEFIAPELAPADGATLHMQAATHALRRVLAADQAVGASRHVYELRPYEELFTLDRPQGGTRSLFGPDGLVPGAHGVDPVGGFASGIRQPGVLRQYGHHAISHVGRRHFDDPDLLENTFVAPGRRPAPQDAPPADVVMSQAGARPSP